MTTRSVAVVRPWVSHFRDGLYDRMRTSLASEGVALRVLAGEPVASEAGMQDLLQLPWFEHLPNRAVGVRGTEIWWQSALQPTADCDLVIVEQATKRLVNYPMLARQRRGGPAVGMWGHGRTPPWEPPDGVAPVDALKKFMSTRAHWWFAYNQLSVDIVAGMGFPQERITSLENTIDTGSLRDALAEQRATPEAERRRALGLGDGPIGVYCGRLYADKRLDFVLEAARAVRARVPDFELVVIGDGPDRPLVDRAASVDPWIHAVGAQLGTDRVPWFSVADVTLLPVQVGLTVIDAFALEAPLVASRAFPHGPEVAYLDDSNGLFVQDGADPRRHGEAIADLLADRDRLAGLKDGCRAAADHYTMQNFADRFTGGILAALAAPRR